MRGRTDTERFSDASDRYRRPTDGYARPGQPDAYPLAHSAGANGDRAAADGYSFRPDASGESNGDY